MKNFLYGLFAGFLYLISMVVRIPATLLLAFPCMDGGCGKGYTKLLDWFYWDIDVWNKLGSNFGRGGIIVVPIVILIIGGFIGYILGKIVPREMSKYLTITILVLWIIGSLITIF